MNKTVDNYLLNGCERCSLGGTPDCKVYQWTSELDLLRKTVLECGLNEDCKWGVPCYTYRGNNILLISAFKTYCAISFFKGALLADKNELLEKPGKYSQSTRLIKFTNLKEIQNIKAILKTYIFEAVEIEKAGLKVEFKKNPEPVPAELENKFEEDLSLKNAFEALTPGRQRGYILYFSQAKQAKTRIARIEKCTEMILNGKGLNDNYKSAKR